LSTLREILEAAADQIRTVMAADSDWYVQVEPVMVLNPTPPVIDMYPADPSNDSASGSYGSTYEQIAEGFWVNIRARVNPNDNVANQELLLELMDPASDTSVVQALYDDPTLGGVVADVNLDSTSGFVLVPKVDGSAVHVGVIWRFLILAESS
jgi:hypothetical protein